MNTDRVTDLGHGHGHGDFEWTTYKKIERWKRYGKKILDNCILSAHIISNLKNKRSSIEMTF
jgi:hypothetical protein